MSLYRLELWFDYNSDSPALNWGIAKSNASGNSDQAFSQGGTAVAAPNNVASIPDGASSQFDIYVIDVSNDGVERHLQRIQIDYEPAPGYSVSNPIFDATGLRTGMTGDQFNGSAVGYTTTPTEVTVFSATPNVNGQRRWSLASGFEGLTDGHYLFTGSVQIELASDSSQCKTFTFDPEMDVEH